VGRLLGLAALVVGSGAAWAQTPAPRKLDTPDVPKTPPEGSLVLPFLNGSRSAGLDWLRVGLAAELVAKLDAHPGLRPRNGDTIVPEGPLGTVDAAGVAAAAAKAHARWVWTGSFTRPEWRLDFNVRLWSVERGTATLVAEQHEHGDFSDVFELLDDALANLLPAADRPMPAAALTRSKRLPTKDFYAFSLYGRGLLAMTGLGEPPDLARAGKELARSVFIDPKLADAHRALALLHLKKGEHGAARGQLGYALDLDPDDYRSLALLLRLNVDAKNRDEAIDLAVKALRLRPWDLDVRYLLGDLLWELGDTDGALRELRRVTDAAPDHLPARRVLVLVHAAMGNVADLAAELEEITRLDPDDGAAKLDLGAAYHALGDDERAIAIYEAVIQKEPKHMQALKFLGDLYRKKGDLATSIRYYERALAANRNDPRPYFLLGAAYLSAGDDDKALAIYREATRFPRYIAETYSNLGALYYKRGQNEAALSYLKVAAARKPRNPRIHYNYGLALARAHVRDKALDEFVTASELDPSEADFQYGLGVALLRVGRLEDAEKAFQAAIKLDPAHKDAQHNLQLIDELRRRAREGEIQVE
jgi:Flp pilus assembly protein TadD/TolB-like protein